MGADNNNTKAQDDADFDEPDDSDRDIDSLIPKIEGWEIPFLLDPDAGIWSDSHLINIQIAKRWEWIGQKILLSKRAHISHEDLELHDALLGGEGQIVLQGFQKAQFLLNQGQLLYAHENFSKALELFKESSNLFFKFGDRPLSDLAKNWIRRTKVSQMEQRAEHLSGMPVSCICVCRRIRAFDAIMLSTRRTGIVRTDWKGSEENELSLKAGDVVHVLGQHEDISDDQKGVVWLRGKLKDKEGIFPTRKLLYRASGRPVLDSAGNHASRVLIELQPSAIFAKYSKSIDDNTLEPTVGSVGQDDANPEENSNYDGILGLVMDCQEFCFCLIELGLMAPEGYTIGPMQIAKDDAVRIFREANRSVLADDDSANCTFEEFEDAMKRICRALQLPEERSDIERTSAGLCACTRGERHFEESISLLNQAHQLIKIVDESWMKLIGLKVKKRVMDFAAFQESHARQLTDSKRFDWAAEKYERARALYSGETGIPETTFKGDQDRLKHLHRAFTFNQNKMAMQFLILTSPNKSSHRGIPPHVGNAKNKTLQMDKAIAVFRGLDDHISMATILRAHCEMQLRNGDCEAALKSAFECMNEYSRLSDGQGLAAAYRLLADVQLVDGQVTQAIGSLQSSLQVSADHNDQTNESNAHAALGDAYFWLGKFTRAEKHFKRCLELCNICRDIRLSGHAVCGQGYIAIAQGKLLDGVQNLQIGIEKLHASHDRVGISKATFETARVGMVMSNQGWQRKMEDSATILSKTMNMFSDQENKLMQARARAQMWLWRTKARLASELQSRMKQGESLIDTVQQLSWEAMQEGKAALSALKGVGDRVLQAEMLCRFAEIQMLGLKDAKIITETLKEASHTYKTNSSKLGLARVSRLLCSAKIRSHDYKGAVFELEACCRMLQEAHIIGGEDEAEALWYLGLAKRLRGDADEGREEVKRSMQIYQAFGGSRLCSLCSCCIVGACYTCLECYQRDYCKDCYAECAFVGRSCHRTSSMLRSVQRL